MCLTWRRTRAIHDILFGWAILCDLFDRLLYLAFSPYEIVCLHYSKDTMKGAGIDFCSDRKDLNSSSLLAAIYSSISCFNLNEISDLFYNRGNEFDGAKPEVWLEFFLFTSLSPLSDDLDKLILNSLSSNWFNFISLVYSGNGYSFCLEKNCMFLLLFFTGVFL